MKFFFKLNFLKNVDDEKVNAIAIEIFSHFVEAVSTLVREFILSESNEIRSSSSSASNNGILNISNNKQQQQQSSTSLSENYEDISDFTLLNLVIKNMINDPDQG